MWLDQEEDPGERPAPGRRPTANEVVAEAQRLLATRHGVDVGFKQVDRFYRRMLAHRRKAKERADFIIATEGAYNGSGDGLRQTSARTRNDPVGELAADLADGIMKWGSNSPGKRKSDFENSTKSSLEAAFTYEFDKEDKPNV